MSTLRDQELCRLLEEAMALPTEQLHSFLGEAASDQELAQEVEALLRNQTRLDPLVAEPPVQLLKDLRHRAGSSMSEPAWEPQPSDHLGPYQILRRLGRGGMGSVYAAQQEEPVSRRVAVKLIRPSLVDDQTLRRFEAERQALARLTHPNVARLYEAGSTQDGSPFFAMEMVEGAPITTHCDEARLDLRARIELFRKVCDGVAHAHQKGVLHRDLKPSNILVTEIDGLPTAKIIDFGIAKAMDRPLLKATLATGSNVIGTPAYMSPEGAENNEEVDTRSDVYSLGVVLYELLVGIIPLGEVGDSPLRMLKRISEEQPSRPAAKWQSMDRQEQAALAERREASSMEVLRVLEGDLESIVLKTLAKEPGERYGSVRELNDDLGRFLRDETVEARRPTFTEQALRFVRRRKTVVTAAALILLSLIGGIIGTSFGLLRAREEAASAQRALTEAREVSSFMISLFEDADVARSKGQEPTIRDLLERGAHKAETSLRDQPAALARFQTAIGSSFIGLGDLERAEPHLQAALDLYAADRETHLAKWTEAIINLTAVVKERDSKEALLLCIEAEETLGERITDFPRLRALLMLNRASLDMDTGEYAQARERLKVALTYYETVAETEKRRLAQVIGHLAVADLWLGNYVDSERSSRRSLALLQEIYGPNNVHVALAWHNIATVSSRLGRLYEAEEAYSRSLQIQEQALGPEAAQLMAPLHGLGTVQTKLGRLESAESLLNRALGLFLKGSGPDHPTAAYFHLSLGWIAEKQGELDRAVELVQHGLEIREKALGTDHPLYADATVSLANLRGLQGRPEEGVGLANDSLLVFERRLEPNHPSVVEAMRILGLLQTRLGRYDEAERRLLQALEIHESAQATDPITIGTIKSHLAELSLLRNRLGEAEDLARQSLEARRPVLGAEHPDVAESSALLAEIRHRAG